MRVFILDTETTGFFSPSQRIMQFAGLVLHLSKEHLPTVSSKIMTLVDSKTHPTPGAFQVHGITYDDTLYGMDPNKFAVWLEGQLSKADLVVGHNISYDMQFIDHAIRSNNMAVPKYTQFCTMEESKGHLRLPPTDKMKRAGFLGYKNPRLEEAYEFFMGKPMEDAHDALADVEATLQVFLALVKIKSTGKYML